jgi:hypothetical protein
MKYGFDIDKSIPQIHISLYLTISNFLITIIDIIINLNLESRLLFYDTLKILS